MSVYHYPNNEILLPKWTDPEARGGLKWWMIALPILLLLLLLLFALWHFKWGPELNAKRASVTILVDTDGDGKADSQGSGVLISPKGYILTSQNVVHPSGSLGTEKYQVLFQPGSPSVQTMKAFIEKNAEGGSTSCTTEGVRNNWAVLRVTPKDPLPYIRPAVKTDFDEEEGMKLYGFPKDAQANSSYGTSVKVEEGKISRVDRSEEQGVTRLTHSAPTLEGMGGGPIAQNGRLIGISCNDGSSTSAKENYALPVYLLNEAVFKNYASK